MATPRVATGALIREQDGSGVLLVRPTYKPGWDLPGGYVEPGESPAAACARELAEEIGLVLAPSRLLVVDWAPHPDEGDKLLFVFDGGCLTSRDVSNLTLDPGEIAEARFHPPDSLAGLMPDRLVRRLLLALEAVAGDVAVYAEHGAPLAPAAAGPKPGP
ncbi:MAG: NUDIX hydrolase [Kineosporiaceae bacterium]|nr:NUDIX hydrolase [Kineosporiaceae bacterium]